MSEWKAKRFWQHVNLTEAQGGFGIALDDRPVRSPNKTPLILPNRPFAQAVAEEWSAQRGVIDPGTMPLTRMANSALDKVSSQRAEVIRCLALYGETDLLCYRAEQPEGLVMRQAAGWDPVLAWSGEALGARLSVATGVMPIAQPPEALARLSAALETFDDFALTGVHDLVALSGSLVLALALTRGHVGAVPAWTLSRIDEDWQTEQWGDDDEAAKLADLKSAAFFDAWRCFCLSLGRNP